MIFSESCSHSSGGNIHKQQSIPLVITSCESGSKLRNFAGNMMRPFSSSVLLYSPENTFFSTFFYLSPLSPTACHFTGKMINVNALFADNCAISIKMRLPGICHIQSIKMMIG